MQKIEHERLANIRNLKLNQYRALIRDLDELKFPFSLLFLPKFNKRCREANIISLDEKRVEALDYLIDRLFDAFILVDDNAFEDSVNAMSIIVQVARELQEYPLLIAAAKAYATLLQA